MSFQRSSGVLLHPTSLPSAYGIGDLGPEAYRLIDFLSASGCKLWQVLPLGPTGYGDSPYQCFSAYAGNPYLISFDMLIQDGLLASQDVDSLRNINGSRVDFGRLIPLKLDALRKAFSNYLSNPGMFQKDFDAFRKKNKFWLDDYALFMALKEANGGGAWNGWDASLKKRDAKTLANARKELAQDIERTAFFQFIFFRQWDQLRAYAAEHSVQIIGDIPIFVAFDSADVWANPELFFLDKECNPTVVAGVPPDGFSATGQLWGNPLYNWKVHKQENFKWWLSRVSHTLKSVDIIRMDHFRGFAGYYEIPASHKTAEHGKWIPAPGMELFEAIVKHLKIKKGDQLPIIAEDLGLITPDVIELRETFNLPGMKILQFGFSGPENPFLPHHYSQNCVAYTGTHDNDTTRGWYETAPGNEREFALHYLRVDGSDFAWDLVRSIWESTAVFAIAPMQDLLNLGGEARMNYPSRLGGNWEWRMDANDLSQHLQNGLKDLNFTYSR